MHGIAPAVGRTVVGFKDYLAILMRCAERAIPRTRPQFRVTASCAAELRLVASREVGTGPVNVTLSDQRWPRLVMVGIYA
jgi:hypothetical protein